MKEHVQKPGVRKWAGEDLLELQGESLTAIQALVEPYAPCIIQGCGVDQTDGVYQVQPGIVALKGSNEDGSACTKIVRFAGYTGEVLPVYLTIKVTPYMRVYADEENKPIAYEYTAEAFTNEPADIPYLKIDASGGSRLVDTIGITQKLDREGGNASNVKVVSFKEDTATGRINIAAGMTLKELFGRIYRWLRDLQPIAFKEKVEKSDFKDELKTEFNNKVDKDGNKVLSTNDFTDAYKDKLDGIDTGANKYVHPSYGTQYGAGESGNKTLVAGGTFVAPALTKNAQGHVIDLQTRTYTMPSSMPANGGTAQTISSILPIEKGGTGKNNGEDAANALLNKLSTGGDTPEDGDFFISQWAGASNNPGHDTYHRRPVSALWNYIKSKLALVATSGSYNDLTNKPTIPAVNNGTITIKQAGTIKGYFSVNQIGNTTIELTDNNTDTVYTHPQYTVGSSAANGSPAFGGSFTVYKPTVNNLGHTTSISQTTVKIPSSVASASAAGLMSASDKANLDSLLKFRIVGVYVFNENGSLGNYQGFPIGCSKATSPVNPCYKITLHTSNGFSASKSYFIICTAGLGHTIECYDTFVQGGKSTYIIYRNTNGTAELSNYAPRIVIVELN